MACLVVLSVVVTGISFAQRTSSAQQTVTFGVVRAPQLNLSTIAATVHSATSQAVVNGQELRTTSGGTITKVTFSPKTATNYSQNISGPVDRLSARGSELRPMKSGDFAQSALSTSEPLVVTITE